MVILCRCGKQQKSWGKTHLRAEQADFLTFKLTFGMIHIWYGRNFQAFSTSFVTKCFEMAEICLEIVETSEIGNWQLGVPPAQGSHFVEKWDPFWDEKKKQQI